MRTEGRELRALRRRLILAALVLGFAFGGIMVRLGAMQVLDHPRYVALGRERLVRTVTVAPKRGDITDVHGRPLATTVASYRLALKPSSCPNVSAFQAAIAHAAGISPTEVALAALGRTDVYHPVASTLSKDQATKLRAVRRSWRADGVSIEESTRRLYSNGRLAAHVVGFVNSYGEAFGGLEQVFHDTLKGSSGVVVGPTDARGYALPGHWDEYVPARPGKNLRLTIDLDIQQAATEALDEAVRKHTPTTAAVIVMNPSNGDILAMVSWPDFDPNDPRGAIRRTARGADNSPLRNSCVSLAFPPGSVFKLFTVAAALEHGVITPETEIYCPGVRKFGKRDTRCALHNGKRAHGVVTPYDAIVKSCNLAAGEYAHRIGAERFVRFIREIGCVGGTGVGLLGESKGLLPPPERWGNPPHQLAVLGFGQSIELTPLALTTAVCALANDGRVVYPRLVAEVGGEPVAPRLGKQVISARTAQLVREMMIGVVEDEHGTGHAAAVPGYRVGGKTGTAQRTDPVTKRISNSLYDSYFVGLVPGDRPRAVITVLLNEPRNGYYGGVVAAPVFQKIASFLVTHWRLRPNSTDTAWQSGGSVDIR